VHDPERETSRSQSYQEVRKPHKIFKNKEALDHVELFAAAVE
jgi:hypothetical protein